MNKNILKSALILTIIGLVCGLLISVATGLQNQSLNKIKQKRLEKHIKNFSLN